MNSLIGPPQFEWQGIDAQGRPQHGTLQAPSALLVSVQLRKQGIRTRQVRRLWWAASPRIKARAITAMTRQWSTLIRAGVSLVPALQMLERSAASPELAKRLAQVQADVEAGAPLSQALAKHPRHFTPLYISMVHAGEVAGILDVMMEQLALTLEKNDAINQRLRSALTYPVVVIILAMAVLLLLLTMVVPVFEEVFQSFGAELPWSTQLILALSQGLTASAPWLLLLTLTLVPLVKRKWRDPYWQRQWHRRVLALPALGPLLRTAVTTRWAHTLSALLAAGVPLAEALPTAGQTSNHPVYARINHHLQRRVSQGGRLSEAMAHTGRFPDLLVQLCATGEDTGALDTLLAKAAELMGDELDAQISTLSSLIEPLIIVVLGGAIGVILVAMYLPIFRLGQVF